MKAVMIETKIENRGHYVPGMISGSTLYISGQLPVHHETGAPMAADIAQQTRDALHNVELVLRAAGCRRELIHCIPNQGGAARPALHVSKFF